LSIFIKKVKFSITSDTTKVYVTNDSG